MNKKTVTALEESFPTVHWIIQYVDCWRSLVKGGAFVLFLIYFSILIYPLTLGVVHSVVNKTLPRATPSSKLTDSIRKQFLKNEGAVFASSSQKLRTAIEDLASVRIDILDINPKIALCIQNWIHSLEAGDMKLARNVNKIIELQTIIERVPPAANIEELLVEAEEGNELAMYIQFELKQLLIDMGYDIRENAQNSYKEDEYKTLILYDDAHTFNQDTYFYGISDGDKQHHANRGGDGQGLAEILPHDVALGQADVAPEKLLQLDAPLAGQVSAPKVLPQLIKGHPPSYPKQLQKQGVEGASNFLLTIEAGRIVEVKVISSTSNLFSLACRAAMKDWRYSLSPKVELRQTFRFEIPPNKV